MFQKETLAMVKNHVDAIALCLRNGLPNPAMVLMYVGIDAFGALGRPVGHIRQPRKDFVAWADRYMVKPKNLPVTVVELYGARCGMLHNLAAESDLSTAGKVRPIIYAWGNREIGDRNRFLEEVARRKPALNVVMVKCEEVADAFVEGIAAFGKDVDENHKLQNAVTVRARKIFGMFDQFP